MSEQTPTPPPDSAPTPDTEGKPDAEGKQDAAKATGRGGTGSGRLSKGLRDIVISMVVLVVAVLGLTALTNNFTFSPGGPTTNSSAAPSVDETQQYQLAVSQVHFPLRQPRLSASWHANSADLEHVAGSAGNDNQPNDMRIGWITPTGHYLDLAQSSADAEHLVRQETGLPTSTSIAPKGQVQVGPRHWTIYSGTRDEVTWVLDLDSVRILITGNGTPEEFTSMATAVQSAPVLPTRGA